MSRGADPPRRPRRPEPPDDFSPEPEPEESTWNPAPRRASGPVSRKPKPTVPTDSLEATSPWEAPASTRDEGPNWIERLTFGSVSSGQLAAFCRQFSSYLDAGGRSPTVHR